jgi:hypothetical protein
MGGGSFRAALEAGDVQELQRIAARAEPHLPAMSDAQAEQVMHDARTRSEIMPLPKRLYSHRWLTERGHDSGLPDHLRASAEQVTPRIVAAVGISVKASSPLLASVAPLIRDAMQDAVLEAQADGKLEDSGFVVARMQEARQSKQRELLGRIGRDG